MDDQPFLSEQKSNSRVAKTGKVQIGFALAFVVIALNISLPSISGCLVGESWACFVLEHDTSFILVAAGVVGAVLIGLGIRNLRLGKKGD